MGCSQLTWADQSLVTCNGTQVSVVAHQSGCYTLVIAGASFGPYCNGTQGPKGDPGDAGQLPLITFPAPNCFAVTGVGGTGTLCNSTGAVTQTTTIIEQTTIVQTTPPPSTIYVDGKTYPLTRAGIQQALNAAFNPYGPGSTVIVTGNVTSDAVALNMVNGVTLDFQGNTFFMPTGPVPIQSLLAWTFYSNTVSYTLVGALTAGNPCVTMPAGFNAQLFQPGQYVLFTNTTSWSFGTLVESISGTTVCLFDSSPFTMSSAVTITSYTATQKFTLRNLVVNLNNNTGAPGWAIFTWYCVDCTWENILLVGTGLGPNFGGGALSFRGGYRNVFRNIGSKNVVLGLGQTPNVRDIEFYIQTHAYIENVYSINMNDFGPHIDMSCYCTWDGLHSVNAKARGFRIDATWYSMFNNIVSNNAQGAAGTGIRIAFGSQHNILNNVVTTGNADFGLIFDGNQGYDNFNTVNGLVSFVNGGQVLGSCTPPASPTDLGFGPNTVGNKVTARVGCPPWIGNSNNLFISENMVGDFAWTVRTTATPPTATDFVNSQYPMVMATAVSNTQLRLSMMGSDQVIRSVVLTVA